ncbi:MAG: efflux RND transporter periplasmic adaptor subunit [Tangfeifania sp.]
MKKILVIFVAALFLAACGSSNVSDEASKQKELQQYKKELSQLEEKIETLENELEDKKTEEAVKISVAELDTQRFEHFIEVTGQVEAALNLDISPESTGVIEAVHVKEGQRVGKGQVLGKLKTDALERTLEELDVQLGLAETNFQRQKNLWDQNIGSEMQFLQAKSNKESLEKRIDGIKAQLEMSDIISPVNGIVEMVYQEKGEIGSPQTPYAKVLNIDKVKIYAEISETYLTKVDEGQMVNISLPAIDRETKAPISQIGNFIDPNNRTFRIRIDMRNPDKMIKPNLVSVIRIRDYVSEGAIVIPSLYIKEDFKGDYTYVVKNVNGTERAQKVYLETGMTNNNRTEILDGLSAGMKIISEGHTQVADGTPVTY